MSDFAVFLDYDTDVGRPYVFEVFAADGMSGMFKPAIQYTLDVIASRYPRVFRKLADHIDESYLGFLLFLEQYYIWRYHGTLSENFYGLKRMASKDPDPEVRGPVELSSSMKLRALLAVAVVPYIRAKLDRMASPQQSSSSAGSDRNTEDGMLGKLRALVRKVWPVAKSLWDVVCFFYVIAYMYGKSKYHHPLLHVMGMEIRRLDMADAQRLEKYQNRPFDWRRYSPVHSNPLRILGRLTTNGLETLRAALPLSIFLLKFLEWYYSSGKDKEQEGLPVPPPPPAPETPKSAMIRPPSDKTDCPICQQKRTNDAALSTTGYVFCYPCIFRYVRDEKHCPITLEPADTDDIIKIYSDAF
eukprot:Clim_evm25s165 gene=Clim_evmTU25s165